MHTDAEKAPRLEEPVSSKRGARYDTDVVIIGGGVAGAIAALVLSRQGSHVTLVERHESYPRDFRVEQLSVERLCIEHVPRWFDAGKMDCASTEMYYRDPVKRACDVRATHKAEYRRSLSIGPGFGWTVHRQQVLLRRRVRAWIRGWFRRFGVPGVKTDGSWRQQRRSTVSPELLGRVSTPCGD